ncbi:MAG: transporter substrate-binding domain-containing protein [Actinomycetota bacterium]|nr:transporter substrate-binding domain-containing protein [Actinomycetota bacterium]
MTVHRFFAPFFLISTGIACTSLPVDPEGTLNRVEDGVMRVGIIENVPWTDLSEDDPAGVEVTLIRQFSEELDATIEWNEGSEQDLFEALKLGQLDLLIGGITSTTPYSSHAALTHPYITVQTVVGLPEEEDAGEDIAGIDVAVEKGTAAAGVLEKTDANPVFVDDIAAAQGAAALEDFFLEDLDLVDSGVTLIESDHVMAVRLGENGWMVRLEEFLLERPDEVVKLLEEEEP